tara:strand:+ start:815 stop:925 length:111 start_codon:yes stop_codon:yes gene_type:complete
MSVFVEKGALTELKIFGNFFGIESVEKLASLLAFVK